MKPRRFESGAVAAALLLAALWLVWHAARDRRALVRERKELAELVAAEVRVAQGRGQGVALWWRSRQAPFFSVRIITPSRLPPGVFRELEERDAPLVRGDTVLAPLRDADDWDVAGAVELVPISGGPVRPGLWRGAVLWPLLALVALTALVLRWSRRAHPLRRRETLVAWSFLGGPLLHLAVFSFAPVLFTLLLSLHRWDLVTSERPYVGLANYRELAADPLFWKTLTNTAVYVLYVPVTLILALGLALLLNRRRKGEKLLRAIVFMPYVTSTVAIALVWQWLMNADFGLVNAALRLVGLPAVDWLGSPGSALLAIIVVTVWTQVGYQMLVLLAGLQAVPQHYLDAAVVDGATRWQRFRHVTLPLLKPVLLFVLVTGVISGFQVFTLVYLMTEGGPLHATDVIVYRIYQTAWEFLRFGSASAMAVVLFAILLVVTVVQFRLLGRRVEHV